MTEFSSGITAHPNVRLGKSVIRGTRVPVDTIVAHLAAGMAIDEIAEEYSIALENLSQPRRFCRKS